MTRDVLDRLVATCATGRLADMRGLAILLLAFASGGRRRSEVARLRIEQLSDEPALPLDPTNPKSPTVEALREWLKGADIQNGPLFRAIDRWEGLEERALRPQSINLIVKRRCELAGLDPKEFAAHGLRSGYLTEAARQGGRAA